MTIVPATPSWDATQPSERPISRARNLAGAAKDQAGKAIAQTKTAAEKLGTASQAGRRSVSGLGSRVTTVLSRGKDAVASFRTPAIEAQEILAKARDTPGENVNLEEQAGTDAVSVSFDPEAFESVFARDEPRGFLNPFRLLGAPTVLALGTLLLAALATIIARQLLGILADIAVLDEPYRTAAYAAIWLVVVITALATVRLGFTLVRLRRSPALSRNAIQELERRGAIRTAASIDESAAGAWATQKLAQTIPTGKQAAAHDRSLNKLGWSDEELAAFRATRDQLVGIALKHTSSESPNADQSAWLGTYRTDYAQPLDACAKRLIRRRALMVAAKTAVLPHGLLDTAVVLTHSVLLIGDLAKVYNLSTNRTGVLALSWRVIVGTLIAGQLEDLADAAGSQLGGILAEAGSGVAVRAGAAVAGQVVGKAGEGAVNALLIHRLGRHAVKRFSPLA